MLRLIRIVSVNYIVAIFKLHKLEKVEIGVWLLTAPDRTGPYLTASDSPDRTPTMTSYKSRVSALSAKK